jgi:hypothetical protein
VEFVQVKNTGGFGYAEATWGVGPVKITWGVGLGLIREVWAPDCADSGRAEVILTPLVDGFRELS